MSGNKIFNKVFICNQRVSWINIFYDIIFNFNLSVNTFIEDYNVQEYISNQFFRRIRHKIPQEKRTKYYLEVVPTNKSLRRTSALTFYFTGYSIRLLISSSFFSLNWNITPTSFCDLPFSISRGSFVARIKS